LPRERGRGREIAAAIGRQHPLVHAGQPGEGLALAFAVIAGQRVHDDDLGLAFHPQRVDLEPCKVG